MFNDQFIGFVTAIGDPANPIVTINGRRRRLSFFWQIHSRLRLLVML